MIETDRKMALGAYVAIAALSLLLAPDKEGERAFVHVSRVLSDSEAQIDKIRARGPRIVLKLLLFDCAAGAMLLIATYLFGMAQIMAEYREMGRAMIVVFIAIANITMLLYDRLTGIAAVLYVRRLRQSFFGRGKK